MAGYVHNPKDYTVEMTDNTTPAPNITTASTRNDAAWHIFDHSEIGQWYSDVATAGWAKFDFGAGNAKKVCKYSVTHPLFWFETDGSKTWELQGSNDDSNWTTLDTQTDVPIWTKGEMRVYTFANEISYRYYKFNIIANQGGSRCAVGELELMPPAYDIEVSIPAMQTEGFTGITAKPSIPMPSVIVTTSDDLTHIQACATIPQMSARIERTLQIHADTTIPSMLASLAVESTIVANATIPMMEAGSELGDLVFIDNVSIPMMSVNGQFGARADLSIPMATVEAEATVGKVAACNAVIPMMEAELAGKTEQLTDAEVSIPMAKASAHLYAGKVIEGSARIPMLSVEMSGYQSITGDIDVSVPMMEAYIVGTPDRFEICTPLRYEEPEL